MLLPVWRHLWAAPCTLLGIALALPALAAGARWRLRDGVVEVSGPARTGRCHAAWSRLPFAAITLGHVVIAATPRVMRRWRTHERVHVRQVERWGIAFIPAYLLAGAWQSLHGRSAYRDNPFEVQARSDAGR